MEFLLDNPETEKIFQKIIHAIPSMQNGLTAQSMVDRGIVYEKNWGVSIVDLKDFAAKFERDHLLALKLWNKHWRETMLLATMLDNPKEVTEEQMDYWVKTAENIELVENVVSNLLADTKFAFVKAMEWCRGKKYLVKYAGLMLMSRMALSSRNAIDEMFEPFFELLLPLSKDRALYTPLFRSVCQLARRSPELLEHSKDFASCLCEEPSVEANSLGKELLNELASDFYIQ